MALSVVGAGLGRTGTLSLKGALEKIGFGPCFHMVELMQKPERITYWDRAGGGEAVNWDEVFAGYNSSVDWPSCNYYRELAEKYPGSKVILTLRDPDKWFDSTQATIFKAMDMVTADARNPMGSMIKKNIMRMFGYNMHDRANCIAVYNKHNEEVKRTIPASRLLVFNVAEGWGPLCKFLDVPMPAEPFPAVNSTEEFQQRLAPKAQAAMQAMQQQ